MSLRLRLKPSLLLAGLILCAHAAAAACAWIAVPRVAGGVLAVALLALGAASAFSRAMLRAGKSVIGLDIDGADAMLHLTNGDSLAASISPRRYVNRWFVTLPLARPARRTLLITADMLDPEAFRRLRLWALWGKLPVAGKQLPA